MQSANNDPIRRGGPMRFGSVCSGIEAASVAFEPLGWKAAWFSEIEPFPSAVLSHHYPDVPNLGDMTQIAEAVALGSVEAPDMLCGGTPCQAFSVAGLRQSLNDARGNLSLVFCELADAIDNTRTQRGDEPCVVFWENVPGVLSTSDNAFGCFLAGLAGEDEPLVAPGGKWSNAGAVLGPKRAVAWRVLDAQYFGLAQRRRRVFVVASARNGFDPAQVLFEWDGVRRDSAPSREAGQGVAGSLAARAGRGFNGQEAHSEQLVTHTLLGGARASGGYSYDDTPLVPAIMPTMTAGPSTEAGHNARSGHCRDAYIVPVLPIDMRQASRGATMTNNRAGGSSGGAPGTGIGAWGDPSPTISTSHPPAIAFPAIAFPANLSGTQHASTENLAPSLGAANPTAVAVREVAQTITSNYGKQCDNSDTALGPNVARSFNMHKSGNGASSLGIAEDRVDCLRAFDKSPFAVQPAATMQVRRLTPRECERLQGFPDDYTLIPWRKKPASECPDGPRHKALGNSWAVPCVRWIGERLTAQLLGAPVAVRPKLVMHESVRALFHVFLRRIQRAMHDTTA